MSNRAIFYPLKNSLIELFIFSVILTSLIEFLTGFILEKAFHYRWWDYSKEHFNLGGYICLKFSIIWGLACVFVTEIVHPGVRDIVLWIPKSFGEVILGILYLLMIIDFVVTVKTVLKLNARMEKLQMIADDIHKFSDKLGNKVSSDFLDVEEKIEKFNSKREKEISWLEKRIIHSFPEMKSTKYNNIFKDIRSKVFEKNKKA